MKRMSDSWSLRLLALALTLFLLACTAEEDLSARRPELLLYCGITMVKPMSEIARLIEERHKVKIHINQGGSEDLYQSLKASGVGDLYLPGSVSYRERHLGEGLLGEAVLLGYNRAALIAAKGNPKRVKPDLHELLRTDINVVLCSARSGSIGRETKRILDEAGLYDAALANSVYLTTDSRNLNGALLKGDADLILNWRATATFDGNRERMEIIDLPPDVAKPKKLVLSLLTFSQHPDVARAFMDLAASDEGKAIFEAYGFPTQAP